MMKDRIISLGLIFIVAIFAGILISAHYTTVPMIKQLIANQGQILALQRKIDNQLSPQDEAKKAGKSGVSSLEVRLISIEKKVDKMAEFFKNIQAPAKQGRQRPQEDLSKVYKIDVMHSPVKGKKDAPITIVEFADFECPFCAKFHPVLDQVLAEYPDKVNYIIKNFPLGFHKQAKPSAKAAFAAGEQGKYWEMVDGILKNGRQLSAEKYEELAKEIGLNVKKFKKDLVDKDQQYEEFIQKDMKLAGESGVRGTPTFFLNGKKTRARTLDAYKTEIDAILKGGAKGDKK